MVIFVHMASVWVPFTSESKEAIADYDEIRKEIRLALQECGRRLGAFLRRRERAKSEFRRRNIFELYIEEVVDACSRLKRGKLSQKKLKLQLQKIALKRTGGEKTNEVLGNDGSGPEGLPHSIIVTAEGTEGEAPVLTGNERNDLVPPEKAIRKSMATVAKGKTASRMKSKVKNNIKPSGSKLRGRESTLPSSPEAGTSVKRAKK
jgi:DNA topoisomerase-6 subunit B